MKQFVQKWLAGLARQIIAKHQPIVIGITGSVGKTSTRDAIFAVVKKAYSVRKGEKNFNNEFGLPFTIIGTDGPERNPLKWLWLFAKGYLILWFGSFPKVLIAEMGVDRPGDMDYLLSIAKPNIAVITNIGMSHYEYFKSYEAVSLEKGKLVEALPEDGTAVISNDNELARAQTKKTSSKVITFGFADSSNVKILISAEKFSVPVQTTALIKTNFNDFEVVFNAIGKPHAEAVAAAVAVGLNLNIPVEKIKSGITHYKAVPGRLNFLNGIKHTVLIDDTYNASPDSMKEALDLLSRAPQQKKVAILGDMLELGELSQSSHEEIGAMVGRMNLEMLVTVGSLGRIFHDSALHNGMLEDKVFWFETGDEATEFVLQHLPEESIVLVKGSQGVRMEKVSKVLLADQSTAGQVLPRQYGKWLSS